MTWSASAGGYGLVKGKDGAAGASGLLVKRNGQLYLLSAGHVLAGMPWATGKPGADVFGVSGLKDTQGIRIGSLAEKTTFQSGAGNEGDAALAKLDLKNMSATIGDIEPLGVSGFIVNGMEVKFYSAARSRMVTGTVTSDAIDIPLSYMDPQGRYVNIPFQGCYRCSYASERGDSGSPVFNMHDRVIGLHFWGGGGEGMIQPVAPLMTYFGVQLVR